MWIPCLGRLKGQKAVVTLQTLQSTAFENLPDSDYAKQLTPAYNSSTRSAHSYCALVKDSIVSISALFVKIAAYPGYWLRLEGAYGKQSVVRTRRVKVAQQHLGIPCSSPVHSPSRCVISHHRQFTTTLLSLIN